MFAYNLQLTCMFVKLNVKKIKIFPLSVNFAFCLQCKSVLWSTWFNLIWIHLANSCAMNTNINVITPFRYINFSQIKWTFIVHVMFINIILCSLLLTIVGRLFVQFREFTSWFYNGVDQEISINVIIYRFVFCVTFHFNCNIFLTC